MRLYYKSISDILQAKYYKTTQITWSDFPVASNILQQRAYKSKHCEFIMFSVADNKLLQHLSNIRLISGPVRPLHKHTYYDYVKHKANAY